MRRIRLPLTCLKCRISGFQTTLSLKLIGIPMVGHVRDLSAASGASAVEAQYVAATAMIQEAQGLAQQAAKDAAMHNPAAVAKLVQRKYETFQKAAALLYQASEAGHLEARGRLGRWAMFGIGPFPVDGIFALQQLHDAAIGGDPDSMYWLARLLQTADELSVASKAAAGGGATVARALERTAGASRPAASGGAGSSSGGSSIGDESVADRIARMRQAASVTMEIKALRRKARKAKIAKVLGERASAASGASAPSAAPVHGTAALLSPEAGSEEEMLAQLPPLETNAGLAERWLRRAAAAGHGDARVALGNLSLRSNPPRPAQAAGWYLSAITGAPIGDGEAGGSASPSGAADASPISSIDADAAARHPDALYNLAVLYYDGAADEVPQDRAFAATCFRLAAGVGDPSAKFWLGVAMIDGNADAEIDRDAARGIEVVKEVADSGSHAAAAHYMSQYYRDIDSSTATGLPREQSAALAWRYLRLAEQGRYGPALFDLGDIYYKGLDGAEKDQVLALEYYERAGAEGETGALLSAGAMRLRGYGCVPDAGGAFRHYRHAADLGSVQGWINMADMYENGMGIEKNIGSAMQIRKVVLPSLGVNLPEQGPSAVGSGIDPEHSGTGRK